MPHFPRAPPEECEECEDDGFLNTYCNDCDQWMCGECDNIIHKKGKRARHTRRYRKETEECTYGDAVRGSGERRDESMETDYSTLPPSGGSSSGGKYGGRSPGTGYSAGFSPFAGSRYPPSSPSTLDTPPPPSMPPPDDDDDDDDEDANWVPPSKRQPPTRPPPTPTLSSSSIGGSESSLPSLSPSLDSSNSLSSTGSPPSSKIDGKESASGSTSKKSERVESVMTGEIATLIFAGMLKKKKKKGFRVWQPRWIKLYTHELQYYRKKDDAAPAGTINLAQVKTVAVVSKNSKGVQFEVVLNEKYSVERTYDFMADKKEECNQWVKLINDANVDALKRISSGKPLSVTPTSSPAPTQRVVEKEKEIPASASALAADSKEEFDLEDDEEKNERDCELTLRLSTEWKEFAVPIGNAYHAHDRVDVENQSIIFSAKKKDDYFKDVEKMILDMSKVDHPNFATLLHHGYSSDRVFAVYQPPGSSLAVHLDRHRRFPENVARSIAAQLIQGLEWLHENRYVFQNLAADRIFLDPEDGRVLICDFLLGFPPEKMPKACDTPEYAPPDPKYTTVSDWWRFGILIYELVIGVPPVRSTHPTKADLPDKIRALSASSLVFPPFVSDDLRDLIRKLLIQDPAMRLGARGIEDVKKHFWFTSSIKQWENLLTRSLPWINENVIDNKVANYNKTATATRYKYSVQVDIIEARNLPSAAEKGVFCQVQCEDQSQATPVVRDTENPSWKGSSYSFPIDPENTFSQLIIEILLDSKNKTETQALGAIVYSIPELKQMAELDHEFVDVWSSIIEPSGLPSYGELKHSIRFITEKADAPPRGSVSLQIPFRQTFFDYFGKPVVIEEKKVASPTTPPPTASSTTSTPQRPTRSVSPGATATPSPSAKKFDTRPPGQAPPSRPDTSPAPVNRAPDIGIGSRPAGPSVWSPPPEGPPPGPPVASTTGASPARKPLPGLGAVKLPPPAIGVTLKKVVK